MACAGACIAGASGGLASLSSTSVGAGILGALGLGYGFKGYKGSRLMTKKRRRKSISQKKKKKTRKRPSQSGGFQFYQSSSTSSNKQQQIIDGNKVELFMNEGIYQFNNQSNKNGSYIVRVTERGKSPKQRCFQTQSEALKTFHKIVTYFSP